MEAPLERFSHDQIARARRTLADPDPTQSPALRAVSERVARHVLAAAEAQCADKIVHVSRATFRAGPQGRRLTCIDGGRE